MIILTNVPKPRGFVSIRCMHSQAVYSSSSSVPDSPPPPLHLPPERVSRGPVRRIFGISEPKLFSDGIGQARKTRRLPVPEGMSPLNRDLRLFLFLSPFGAGPASYLRIIYLFLFCFRYSPNVSDSINHREILRVAAHALSVLPVSLRMCFLWKPIQRRTQNTKNAHNRPKQRIKLMNINWNRV